MAAEAAPIAKSSYDVVFSFDTTGSMSACIKEVRKQVKETVTRLFKDIPEIKIGIVAHGDYCDEKSTYLMKFVDITDDQAALISFVENVGSTGGGDYPEAYEYVLNKVQSFSWNANSMRALVMIGDAYPHPVNDNPHKLDWRNEVEELKKMDINIYSVQALCNGHGLSYTFYKQMAAMTNGYHLFLDQFVYIIDMFIAICYRQKGNEQVEQYEQELIKKNGGTGLSKSMRKMFDTMLNRKNADADKEDYYIPPHPGAEHVPIPKKVVEELRECPPSKYQLLTVDEDISIKKFVIANELTFKVGKGFYEFTKPEDINPAKKEVVLMNRITGDLFEGERAKEIAGITVNKKYKPSDLKEYKVFIQSTSYNRKLIGGTSFLYEAEDYGKS